MGVLSTLLTGMNLSVCVMMAACSESPVQSELLQMAAALPKEDISNLYLDKGKVEDYNGDGVPEIYLTAGGGWNYLVCYYLNDEMHTVESLEPWSWSSDLCYTEDGRLVLYAWSHTMGTAGYDQRRIYEWTEGGCRMAEDLWSVPDEWDREGMLLSCQYISKKEPLDPTAFEIEAGVYDAFLISQNEYEKKISNLGTMTSVFEDGLEWGWTFWQENDYEDDAVMDGIYRQIQEEILNWQ